MQRTLFDYIEESKYCSKCGRLLVDNHCPVHIQDMTPVKDSTDKKGITFPCDIARELPIGKTRCNHVTNCSECQRLIKELDKIAYGKNNISE